MARALTPPELLAALVVLVAGVAKLHDPRPAAEALGTLGIPRLETHGRAHAVRGIAGAEVLLAVGALVGVGAAPFLLAALYLAFAGVALVLVRVRTSCGCFGESRAPASALHVGLDLVLAAVCAAAGTAGCRGLDEVLRLPAWQVVVAVSGILAAAVATVLAFTEVPRAWQAWRGVAG